MITVLIIDGKGIQTLKIAKKIAALYSDLSIITTSDADEAMKALKSEKPQVVVMSIDTEETKGRDLLEQIMRWDLKIFIYRDEELLEIFRKTPIDLNKEI